MSPRRRRPSLLAGLLWTGLGLLFLLRNFGIGPDTWHVMAAYWPVLLILLGLGKVIDHYRQKEGVSVSFGEVVTIFLLLLIGSAVSRISTSHFGRVVRDMPINIGGTSIQPGQWLGVSYTFDEEASYAVAAHTPLRIENSNGLVSLTPGSGNQIHVRLRKTVYEEDASSAKEIAGQIKLEGGEEGKAAATTFVIRTNREDLRQKDYRFNTDLEIAVPPDSQIQIRNAFGEIKVANLTGKFDLNTSHQPIDVRDCKGEFVLASRFSESHLANLTGNVTIAARGRVSVEAVKGNVTVRNEYSPVQISDVDGQVTVSTSESNIVVEKITKPVTIEAPGTQLVVRNLSDTLKAAASYRQVDISDVAGDISLDTRYATLSLSRIKGAVEIASDSDRIKAEEITGRFKVRARRTSLNLDGIEGPIDAVTTLKDVVVANYRQDCTITNEYGEVSLSNGSLPRMNTTVKNRNGTISLYLPENAAVQINATAKSGRVNCDYPGLSSQSSGDISSLKGSLKGGGAKIILENEYGDIRIQKGAAESKLLPEEEPNRRFRPRRPGSAR
jgi:DUF4097 and DUF4098 domain-containing protein YvlB